jgi:probable HAF family extracellular repeat protein
MKTSVCFELRIPRAIIGSTFIGLILAAPSFAQSYTAFDIGTLGGPGTVATALNAGGQVTGNSDTANGGPNHAFVTKSNGRDITDLGTFAGGDKSFGLGINSSGQVVGQATGSSNGLINTHAFITGPNGSNFANLTDWNDSQGNAINDSGQAVGSVSNILFPSGSGAFVTGTNGSLATELGGMKGSSNGATDINASGEVVGYANITSSVYRHAFITSPNHVFVSDLGSLGGYDSAATGINNSGKVVGYSWLSPFGAIHAFITDVNSNMTDLGTLGGQSSYAFDINSTGEVVGQSHTAAGNAFHAFITGPNGIGMTDLNSLVKLENGTFLVSARGINDKGQIITNASDGHSYLLSPVPELQTYAMFMAGLGLIGFMGRRKKQG